AVNGVATFANVDFTSIGSCTLTATDSTRALTTATSSPATTVSPGAASKVVFTTEPPTTATAGTDLTTFAVSIEDAYGDVETTVNFDRITLTTTSVGCTLGGTDHVTTRNGVATFSAVTITAGTSCTLTATDSSETLATATSTSVTL
ncbi:MAG: hypothetical protein ACRDVC_08795, partial [Acidimicrobiales bacterium]